MKDPEIPPQATGALASMAAESTERRAAGADLVRVTGELDLDSAQDLYSALRGALDRSVSGLIIDLQGVGFCDCSGLNALLRLRHRALAQGKTISIQGTCPEVERLLTMTHTRSLFTTVRSCSGSHPARAMRRSA